MSRTNFNFGGWPSIVSWTACPFCVGSCLQLLGSSATFSLRCAQPLWFPVGAWVYLSFRFLPLVVVPETLSLLRFAWLADWVAICQPGFYWRLKGLQLSLVVRGGIQ